MTQMLEFPENDLKISWMFSKYRKWRMKSRKRWEFQLKNWIFKKDQTMKMTKSEIILGIEEEMIDAEGMIGEPQDRSYKHREKQI